MRNVTVGDFLFDQLYGKGVRHVFGVPGDFALPIFKLLENSKLKIITMAHEPSVGFAADAYARNTGLGVALVTYGVGALNMVNSVACAYAEKSPILVISGAPSLKDRNNGLLLHHEVRDFDSQRKIYQELTCADAVILDTKSADSEILRVIDEVLYYSRPGYLEIGYDVISQLFHPSDLVKKTVHQVATKEFIDQIAEKVVDKIDSSKKPVILAGAEVMRQHLSKKVLRLVNKSNIPIAASIESKSAISEIDSHYLGIYSGSLSAESCKHYVEHSDCLIMLGTTLSDSFFGFDDPKIHLDKAIVISENKVKIADEVFENINLTIFLDALLLKIHHRTKQDLESFKEEKALSSSEIDDVLKVDSLFAILEKYLPIDLPLVADVGESLFGALDMMIRRPENFLSDPYYLSMGFALPASIGVMAARDTKRAIIVVGDGAFQMSCTELSTAAKYGMHPIVIVINNDGYSTQRGIIDGSFNDIQRWNYQLMPDLINSGQGVSVVTPQGFADSLEKALDYNGIFVINAIVPRNDHSHTLRKLGQSLKAKRNQTQHLI